MEDPSEFDPLLPPTVATEAENSENISSRTGLDRVGLRCLLIQHLSSAWNDRTAEFALYLYLILHYKDTLLPSSILGFSMTASGVTLSRAAGSLIDTHPKLPIVRILVTTQKLSSIIAYASCAIITSSTSSSFLNPTFFALILSACVLHFCNIAISIAVERDWASCISRPLSQFSSTSSEDRLARLNTYLRQINLLCKLCAPLFVSTLTVNLDSTPSELLEEGLSSVKSIWVLSVITALSLIFELYWIGIVYHRFPALALEQAKKDAERRSLVPNVIHEAGPSVQQFVGVVSSRPSSPRHLRTYIEETLSIRDWHEMVHLPIFFSSASISLLYLTVLSFDGIMISYLKTLSFTDSFIAEMRGLCVITGLIGTMLASPLERKVGSVRAGNWSIWSMVFSLVPVIVSFYVFAPHTSFRGEHAALGLEGGILLFGGMALSRIGLWSFDLIQTKQLQDALLTHPRKNTLTGLQYTMQNVADLMKYILTMILYRPSQFRWAATVSFASIFTGAITYMIYVKKERGHIAHIPIKMDWVRKML